MNTFKPHKTNHPVTYDCPLPHGDSLKDFINFLLETENKLIKDNCYPNSVTIHAEGGDYYSAPDSLVMKGYRPENEKEKLLRLKKLKKVKELNKKLKEEQIEQRRKWYLELKQEFEGK